ncbi:hypothetical protein GLOIN_2v1475793 [Rhizophagus irregularis DAOM 181602=DAOM 197198]|uniref:BAH domain-containing protein n=1 Tax=Rhizophagus irregularis (strain DAOM 181602 / DAOM 197198 / MUCL 43194) TaxID=747089 RepID=A0A2P4QBB6_RHIID|nr:hypothetical protein GLOIN_2v1475793 [Rhizophagus irregularis DAOM 181602=DAOM 197198]POG74932.1 hypothetical protein GLOIN_2v1475793 [Rhizophagus irregularis DAOM 181602=DAOM 197198]|eukprot:XP_025181798.1 hypothetical protein GLOIN_2v1475793 [Rhizophagus irregularis DAOM 181602=DAOM 197198]
MLRKTFRYKHANKQLTLHKRYSYISSLRDYDIKNAIKAYSNNPVIEEPLLNYSQITNETTNEFSLMQNYDEINHIAEEIPTDNEYNTQYDSSEKERDITDNEYDTDSESQNDNSEKERHITDNEYDTDSESQNNSSEKERHIIDNALDPSRLPNNTSDFSPYFDNITTALLFCWIQKHNISIMNHMYFGPGIEANVKSEFWHGTLWAESPLFGQEKIVISQVTYYCGEFIYYLSNGGHKLLGFLRSIQVNEENQYVLKIQKLLYYEDIPGIFKGHLRQQRSKSGEVWMLDDNFVFICPSQVYNKATVKLPHLHQVLSHSDLYVLEIIYKHNNHWRVRDIQLSYQHPAHSIIINNPPVDSMPVYKLFLDLYYDDFGTFRNVYHSLGGVYVQFGNMPAHMRKRLKNHFVIGFVPFGGNFDEFIQPFINELKEFEKGKIMNIQGRDVWVVAGLGVVTADLPQGNDLSGVLRHGATKGCRTCTVEKYSYTDNSTDIIRLSRYKQCTDLDFSLIAAESSITRKKQIGSEFGLRIKQSILDELQRERHLQTPQDIYHATAGKIKRLLRLTCELFSHEGENAFIRTWKALEKPKKWAHLPNPISHHESFMMSDYLRLAMIMPFILHRFLKVIHIKSDNLALIQQRINVQRNDLVPKYIVKCWVCVAQTMKIAFDRHFTNEKYIELQRCLDAEMNILTQVFEEFVNLPNLHLNFHFLLHARTYATLSNTQVGCFYDIKLKQRISSKNTGNFVTFSLQDANFKAELYESYKDLKLNSALINSSLTWYQRVSYMTEDNYGNTEKVCLQLGDILTIQEEECESYAKLQSIFQHKGNDDKFYVFIVVAWFEYVNQNHTILECPIYRLNDRQWRRVFPITVIDKAHKAHFIRRSVDTDDGYWYKNQFYFTAI